MSLSCEQKGNLKAFYRTAKSCISFLLISIFLLYFNTPSYAKQSIKNVNVMLLHAQDQFLPANIVMDKTFYAAFKNSQALNVSIYSEYLEKVRFNSKSTQNEIIKMLQEKYDKVKLDLLVITDDLSLDFIIENRNNLFVGIPVVLCGITEGKLDVKSLDENVTGNFKLLDIEANIETILKVQPETTKIYVVIGTGIQDAFYESLTRKAFLKYQSRIKADYIIGLSIEETQERISKLPQDSVIFYVSMYKDGAGKGFNPRDVIPLLKKTAIVPIYGVSDTYLMHGIIGGNLVSFTDLSADAAEIALKILNGKKPREIKARVLPNKNYFDWVEMKKWGIKESALPKGSIIVNKKPGVWDLYRWQIVTFLIFLVLETLLVFYLMLQLSLKKQAKRKLIDERNLITSIMETSPVGIITVDSNGQINFANAQAIAILGLTIDEISQRVYNAPLWKISDIDGSLFPDERLPFSLVMSTGKSVFNVQHAIQWPEGKRVLLSINGAPLMDINGHVSGMVASIEDITERKHAEEKVIQSLREKETLIREIYHRTKNTMQVIRSIILLQAMEFPQNTELQKIVKNTEDKIQAISLVHQMLYKSQDLSRISIKEYIIELTDLILQSFNFSKDRISLNIKIDDQEFLLDTAIPFGLIINELMTNSLTHAFPENRKGMINISLNCDDSDKNILYYSDNGVGVDAGFNFRGQNSLGLKLIYNIGELQMMGKVVLESNNGISCLIEFPAKLYKARV